jgi:tight adherence protein C
MLSMNPLTWSAFLLSSSLILLVFLLIAGRKTRLDVRLSELTNQGTAQPGQERVTALAYSALPRMGAVLVPRDEEQRSRLQNRLIHTGFYGRQAMFLFLGVKLLLMLSPPLFGLVAGLLGLTTLSRGLVVGALCGVVGLIGPGFWLDRRKSHRQMAFRRALPDALDVLVICLEGGLSLAGALRRVALELRAAHPLLASEFDIIQREVQLGRSNGEALRCFAERSDLEEIRSLAGVVLQSERLGASLVKALRVHAETLRDKRLQEAEEMAQKAAVKILFPTVLCIFPALCIVTMAPSVYMVADMFAQMQQP